MSVRACPVAPAVWSAYLRRHASRAASIGACSELAEMLRQLLETSEAGRKAASSLSKAISVGVRFTDVPGDSRFRAVDGKPRFEPGKAAEPDFELTLFPGAVHDVCGKSSADVGDLTVLFLQHIFANEPDQKILVKVHSGLVKLTMRGWLRVVVAGCPKLIGWLATPDAARPTTSRPAQVATCSSWCMATSPRRAGGNPHWTRFPRDGARTRSICAGAAGRSLRRAAPQEGRISELLSPRPPPASSRPAWPSAAGGHTTLPAQGGGSFSRGGAMGDRSKISSRL